MRLAIARIAVLAALAASLLGKELVGQDDIAALRAAAAAQPERAEPFYNLAVAEWRAGDLAAAENAIEKFAALAVPPRPDLHRGMLGVVRYAAAERLLAGESPDLQAAKKEAEAALEHFVKGALAAPSPELRRNTERTLRLLDELQKRLEEQQQQQDESKPGGEPSKDDREERSDDQQKADQRQPAESKDPEQQPKQTPADPSSEPPTAGEPKSSQPSEPNAADPERPEPQPQPGQPQASQPPASQPPEGQPQQSPEQGQEQQQQAQSESPAAADGKARHDAPGEGAQPLRLTPEQAKRLMDQLQKLDAQFQALQARSSSRRAKVEKDW